MDKVKRQEFQLALTRAIFEHCDGQSSHEVIEEFAQVFVAMAVLGQVPKKPLLSFINEVFDEQMEQEVVSSVLFGGSGNMPQA